MKTVIPVYFIAILFVVIFSSSVIVLAQNIPVSLTQYPLKQFRMGAFAQDVYCFTGFQLFFKAEDYTPACIKPETATVLVQRGWAIAHLPEPFVEKIAINGLQQNYTIGQPIGSIMVNYFGYYWYTEPDVKILDANGTQIWFNCAYCYTRTEPVQSPVLEPFTYIVRDYASNKHPVINKTGIYTMVASLDNKTASAAFTVVNPLMSNKIIGLENDAGVVTFGNHAYYFETPHYTQDAYVNPVHISFHDVIFTLFPSGFRGGLPIPCTNNPEKLQYYWTDTKFADGAHELLHILGDSPPCPTRPIPTMFSTHTNPQAGLTFYDGKMKLLVSKDNQIPSALKLYMSTDSDMIKPGQPIGITISVNNILATPVEVTSQNNWSYQNVSTGPCSTIGYGISILDGFYDASNMTQGKSLNLFNPGILCPVIQETAKVYEFQPQSDNVKEVQCKSIDGLQCRTDVYSMGQNYKFNGYWDAGIVQHFKSGVYTIIGADEWGHVEIQHFIVTNSTIFAGNLGSMSCPLMSGGTQFSATIKNSTGFANYYNSTQYGNTFLLHPGMHGVIHVQYISPVNASWFENNGNKPFTVTNGATLFYMANVTQGKSTTSYAVSLYDDKTGHHSRICHYATPWGGFAEPCNMDNSGDIPPGELPYASQLLHPGVVTSFEPDSTMLYPNDSHGFTATISANSDAMSGTYWISLGPSLCGPHVLAKLVVVP